MIEKAAPISFEAIEWREGELADTVAFLAVANPKGYSADDIKRHVRVAWEKEPGKPTFIGTAGWYVTVIPKGYEAEKPYIALVSLMSYTALKYLKETTA